MADSIIRSIGLCAGVGMLDLGLSAGLEHLGIRHRTIAYCEREAYAASQLLALMESECLDAAPVWSDLTTFPASEFRGVVDCVTAGFPCQPHSVAGKREGTDDARWIWPAIAGIIRDSGAWLVVLENVRGLLSSGGMAPVLADLADLGFAAEWTVLSAGAVGASHRRERVFIVGVKVGYAGHLSRVAEHRQQPEGAGSGAGEPGAGDDVAHSYSGRLRGLRQSSGRDGQPDGSDCDMEHAADIGGKRCATTGREAVARGEHASRELAHPARHGGNRPHGQGGSGRGVCGDGGEVADTSGAGSQKRNGGGSDDESLQPTGGAESAGVHRTRLADTNGDGRRGRGRAEQSEPDQRDDWPLFAPGPSDPRWPGIIRDRPDLAPAVESSVRSMAHGMAGMVDESRRDQLRAIGNGVVPLQAAAAIVGLLRRLT